MLPSPKTGITVVVEGLAYEPVEDAVLVVGHLMAGSVGVRDAKAGSPDAEDVVVHEDHLLGGEIGHRVDAFGIRGMVLVDRELDA